jgi:hypothetical protein
LSTAEDKQDAEIPTLTDIAPDPDLLAQAAPDRDALEQAAPAADPVRAEDASASDAAAGEVISRVQVQNLEHSVYQKVRQDLDGRIAEVVREQFMPEIGGALGAALEHIAKDLKGNITQIVRASVEEALQRQLPAPAADAVPGAGVPRHRAGRRAGMDRQCASRLTYSYRPPRRRRRAGPAPLRLVRRPQRRVMSDKR